MESGDQHRPRLCTAYGGCACVGLMFVSPQSGVGSTAVGFKVKQMSSGHSLMPWTLLAVGFCFPLIESSTVAQFW